jgi:hypothetical protein
MALALSRQNLGLEFEGLVLYYSLPEWRRTP